jgi:hypothetical protein
MDSTTSATTINKFLISVILNFNLRIFINLALYSIAATTGAITAYKFMEMAFDQLLKILHFRWITKFKGRRELATEIIKLCTEGSTHGWNIKPRDIEYVYFISRLIERENKTALAFFNELVSSWNLNALLQKTSPATNENVKFCQKLQNLAKAATDNLLKIVNKW